MNYITSIRHIGNKWIIETDPVKVSSCIRFPPLRAVFNQSVAAAEIIGRLQMELMTTRDKANDLQDKLHDINVVCEGCGFEYHHQHYEEDKPCPVCQLTDYQILANDLKARLRVPASKQKDG